GDEEAEVAGRAARHGAGGAAVGGQVEADCVARGGGLEGQAVDVEAVRGGVGRAGRRDLVAEVDVDAVALVDAGGQGLDRVVLEPRCHDVLRLRHGRVPRLAPG